MAVTPQESSEAFKLRTDASVMEGHHFARYDHDPFFSHGLYVYPEAIFLQ